MIATTGRLLRRQGYAATGLNEIIEESGAPKGSVYFHFPDGKEELAAAAVERFGELILRHLGRGLESADDVAGAVEGFFDAYARHFEETEFAEGCAVASVALENATTHEQLAGAASHALRSWTDAFARALAEEGHEPESAHRTATLIVAAIEGAIVMAKGERSTEPLESARDALVATLRA